MSSCRVLVVVGLAGVIAGGVLPRPAAAQGAPSTHPLFGRYCVSCHSDRLMTGGLTLEQVDVGEVGANAEVLEKVIRKLRDGLMPPEGRPRPDAVVVDDFVTRLETSLDASAASSAASAGWVASRRLNRTEYVNAVHDLLALEIDGDELLPSDLAGFGFDNNADALAITPALMSRYMTTAMRISRMALGSPDNRPAGHVYEVRPTARQDARMGENMPFATHGGVAVRHNFPLDGEYVFRLRLKRGSGGVAGIEEDEHQIELRVDHALVRRFTIGGRYKGVLDSGTMVAIDEDDILGQQVHEYLMHADDELEARVPIEAGTRTVAAAFSDSLPSAVSSGSPVGVDQLEISGPFNGTVPDATPSRRRVLVCRPAGTNDVADDELCARELIRGLARRAYRRPLAESDIEPLLDLYRAGRSDGGFEAGIGLALEGVLSSPHFLIRVERDPDGLAPGTVYRLSDLELASRLSFFLWRSIPDDELLDLAAEGRLSEPTVLSDQVRRMLGDRRATRFMDDFVEQWLQVRNLRSHEPDRRLFRSFDPTLRDAMVRETKLFFESQVREDRPIPELLRADYTFLNERLARHYGINDVYGSHLRRVTLDDDRRFGLLGQGSVLTVTSYPNRTSVVLRGKWILENLLGSPPPPPPPNVPALEENEAGEAPASLRERMEQHRSNPVCASCHNRIDPLGFALEHYDAVGMWRETDEGADINATIDLSGETVDSPAAFREAVLRQGDRAFVRTVAEKLLTYALGRGLNYRDAPTIRRMVSELEENDYRWSTLALAIVASEPFRMRVAPEPDTSVEAAQQ